MFFAVLLPFVFLHRNGNQVTESGKVAQCETKARENVGRYF